MRIAAACLALACTACMAGAAPKHQALKHRSQVDRHTQRIAPAPPAAAESQPTASDDLYRRRGYGQGGLVFGGGGEGIAQAGACADLAFARPKGCGARGGYGIYGNGLGYGFGF